MTICFTRPQLDQLEIALREDCSIIMTLNADTTTNYSNAEYIIHTLSDFPCKIRELKSWIKTMIKNDFYMTKSREIMDELTSEEIIEQGEYFEFHQTQKAYHELIEQTEQPMDMD